MPLKRIVTCTAPVNIAVIKYWGKSDEDLIIPLNDSISFTLCQDEMCATTTVMLSPNFTQDRFWLNHKEESINNPRLANCLREVRRRASKRKDDSDNVLLAQWHVHIYSVNNFPTAAGLASSAAGYACLVFAFGKIYELEGELSPVARLGSGSACRSLAGGMVQWYRGLDEGGSDCIAKQIAPVDYWGDLHVIICVASDKRKKVSSTLGMKRCSDTVFMDHRVFDILPARIDAIKSAIENKQWGFFCEIVMADSNEMHAVCRAASPPIVYMNDTSNAIVDLVHEYNDLKMDSNQTDKKVCYTFDAGPNACIFVPVESMNEFSTLLNKRFPKDLSYNSPSEKYWQGIQLPPFPEEEENDSKDDEVFRHSIKYFLHTKIGDGPRVLPAAARSHMLNPDDGMPLERPSNECP